ncbi:MAG: DUF3800 domain-containing protein [Finegoldia magna]|uniref:DUF3800 domain-containing protein n=1 Tax=Finegoldia magna TaxID=1260 RepID=UPI0039A0BEBD
MNIYIDESGTINNKLKNEYFIITLIIPDNSNTLKKSYKRFVSSNLKELKKIDNKQKMFLNGSFHELKGSAFNKPMKKKFVNFFSRKNNFSLFYIKVNNSRLNDSFCLNTSRVFNYLLKISLDYFLKNDYIKSENQVLQLDERNERTESKFFLEDYLNTELCITGINQGSFTVSYFDSSNNINVQIADVFSNLLYSHLKTGNYNDELKTLKDNGILKYIFEFPNES